MSTLPADVLGELYRSDVGWRLLADLVDLNNRMPGQEGEHRGAAYVRERFEEHDLDGIAVEEFPIPGWWRGEASLELHGVEPEQRFAHQHELVTLPGVPAGEVTGEIADLGHAVPEDFEDVDLSGKIAMASSRTPDDYDRWVHRMEKYCLAVEAGADGFLFRNHVEGCLPPTGDVGKIDRAAEVPAVGVSKEVGDRLLRYCDRGDVEATLAVDCRNEPATSRNVEAVVGPDTDREVLFTAHVDGHDVGTAAADNGAGCVLVVEVARALKAIEDDLETRVRLVVFGAEETGLYGSYYWSQTRDLDRVKCVFNVDGVGYSRDLKVHTHGFEGIADAIAETGAEFDVDLATEDGLYPHSDHWPFVQRGIPGSQGLSETDDEGRGWGHTHADTLDKMDVRDLRDLTIYCATAVAKLAERDREIEPVGEDVIREMAVDGGYDVGMKAIGHWPWGEDDRPWPWREEPDE
ncbi:M28 family metallopeptidase [Halovivax sp.]|uniref:M28 family metallopeptidase n=1 Tax=Halovivax sp. TaxID=1935978 RepID=UPI0025C66FDE|nr:M28 family metallopeptidase [Halovivax sp.]